MKNKFIFTTLVLMCACTQEQKPTLSEEEKGNIVLEVKQTLDNYYADIRSNGLTAEFKYLDNSNDFYWTPPGYGKPISYDSVASILRKNSGNYKEVDNTFENLIIDAISSDSAFYSGKIKSVITDTANNAMTIYLNEKGRMIKRKDGWKLLSGETTISLSDK